MSKRYKLVLAAPVQIAAAATNQMVHQVRAQYDDNDFLAHERSLSLFCGAK